MITPFMVELYLNVHPLSSGDEENAWLAEKQFMAELEKIGNKGAEFELLCFDSFSPFVSDYVFLSALPLTREELEKAIDEQQCCERKPGRVCTFARHVEDPWESDPVDGSKYRSIDRIVWRPGPGWDPLCPPTLFQKVLKWNIEDALRSSGSHGDALVRMYRSVGTTLDYKFGVDGFIMIGGTPVTYDVTTNYSKRVTNADVLVRRDELRANGFRWLAWMFVNVYAARLAKTWIH